MSTSRCKAALAMAVLLAFLAPATLAAPWTGKTITLHRENAPAAEVVRALAQAMGLRAEVPAGFQATVTVHWENLPVEDALFDLQEKLPSVATLYLDGEALSVALPPPAEPKQEESRKVRSPLGRSAPSPVGSGSVAPGPPPPPPGWNREGYAHRDDQPFRPVRTEPLSTFAVDVDTASYSNVRRFLVQGALPPADAVRVEEMLNYFRYEDPQPTNGDPFAVHTETAECPWAPGHRLLRIGVQGRTVPPAKVPPRNLVFLLDVSGSMASDDKLPLVKTAMRSLVEQLRPEDRVAIVVYAGASGLVLPSTPGSKRGVIMEALERLEAGGSTNGGEGIRLAYDTARASFVKGGINRVLLATDGDFNVGTTSDGELVRLIEKERESGVFLTVLGVGTGNLQDAKMEQIADHGNGHYAYLDSAWEARKVLVAEAGSTLVPIAKDVKIQVEFNPLQVSRYRLIGYENRMLNAEDFTDDKKDAGEIGAGHHVTALYELIPAGADDGAPDLRYQQSPAPTSEATGDEVALVKVRYKQPDGASSRELRFPVRAVFPAFFKASADLRFASAVAAFGMLLRDSELRGEATWEDVQAWAKGAVGEDPEGYRTEFLLLARRAAALDSR